MPVEGGSAVGSGDCDPSCFHGCFECPVGAWALGVRVALGLPMVPQLGRDDVHAQVEQAGVVDERHGSLPLPFSVSARLAETGQTRVTGVDGRPVGWWDLLAMQGHPESADLA